MTHGRETINVMLHSLSLCFNVKLIEAKHQINSIAVMVKFVFVRQSWVEGVEF